MDDLYEPVTPGAACQALERARDDAARLAQDLRAELDAIGESTEASPDDEHDAEGSTVGYERARVAGLLERAERALADTHAALERLHEGVYGTCAGCGRPIPAERLAALPTTTRCTGCAAEPPARGWTHPRPPAPHGGGRAGSNPGGATGR